MKNDPNNATCLEAQRHMSFLDFLLFGDLKVRVCPHRSRFFDLINVDSCNSYLWHYRNRLSAYEQQQQKQQQNL